MATDVIPYPTLTNALATAYEMDPREMIKTIKLACFGGSCTDEQLFIFMRTAKKLDLDPFTREIYAFVKGDKMQVIVGIDGWVKKVVEHPQFDGFELEDHLDKDGKLTAVTCRMWRKDWSRPGIATEYMAECKGTSEPWKKWEIRMLGHKAYIQCARKTFPLSGVIDPDEAERIQHPEMWSEPAPRVEMKPVGWIEERPMTATEVLKGGFMPPVQPAVDTPPAAAPVEADTQNSPSAPVSPGLDLPLYDRLAAAINSIPAARKNLMLGQAGVQSIHELSDEQMQAMIQKLEARKGK